MQLTEEDKQALRDYKSANGRTWKAKLRAAWMVGDATPTLHRLRNSSGFGPAGLDRVQDRDLTKASCTIQKAAEDLNKRIGENFKPGTCTVGIAGTTIIVYEHVRGLAKRRTAAGAYHMGHPVKRKYIGRIAPLC